MREKEIEIDLEGTRAQIIYHQFQGIEVKTFLSSFAKERRCLSTREGFKKVKVVANNYNPPPLWEFVHQNYNAYVNKILSDLNLSSAKTAMLLTGADMDNLVVKKEEYLEFKVFALVTAGTKSNAQRIGIDRAGSLEREGRFETLGTSNVIILTNALLSEGAMARGIITLTEAKVIALEDLDIRSSYDPEIRATGTGTDNAIIVSGQGARIDYLGGHSKMGELMARAVTSAVKEAIFKQNGIKRE
ncbi:MAG: adenosylcobinamide amidohydrolase [Dehalococcoidia bacterium]|nr:adenosylcobinamide amidohydrolase [Dehalococcoidia bacterium]